jgi:hypothetical protein
MPETGTFSMEASANGPNGKMVHYTAEGKLTEGALSGTWTDDSKKGDFKLTKS